MKEITLIDNIIDVIKEQQIKLGYRKERVRLYYPLESLNTLLGTKLDCVHMADYLPEYFHTRVEMFGAVEISHKAERFCINLPEQASEYVHENTEKEGFLYDFIKTIARHDITIDDVLAEFRRYSEHIHFEEMTDEEFDYLVYFEKGEPDSYRYCLTQEGHHIIYHRYTQKDYENLF